MFEDSITGRKTYTCFTSVHNCNILMNALFEVLEFKFNYELKTGVIQVQNRYSCVDVIVYEDSEYLKDCPYFLLTYNDFMDWCKETIEKGNRNDIN